MAYPLPIVAVLNATGKQGKSVVKALSKSSRYDVRALTRDPKSDKAKQLEELANVTAIDSSDYGAAFKGADAVYATSLAIPEEYEIIKSAADAAQRAEVKLFIFSGSISMEKESGGAISNLGHYERKDEVNEYLKTLKLRSITLYLGTFAESFIQYDLLKYENDEIKMTINAAGVNTELPMLYVSADLGSAILLILDNHEQTPALFESPVIITSYKIKFGDHPKIIEKITGHDVKTTIMDTFTEGGDTHLDKMRIFLDEYGLYKGKILPDPRLTALGYKPHSFEDYVKDVLIPTFDL